MATVVDDLYDLVDASGLATGYEKRDVFLEQYTADNQRYLLIRNQSGAASDEWERNHSFSFHFISQINDTQIPQIRDTASAVVNYLLQNYRQGCIINVSLVGDVAGAFLLESGRWYYKFDVNVKSATS